ncbi:MAG: glycosyltransferase family 4 protein [Actinobacteria bacterium]|nr:glycosyltransferase family 4 protein [Actinomycetota bacterium]MBI3256406.1 glycosyltransferase family 4 protein [Actinomycetota bacterium]
MAARPLRRLWTRFDIPPIEPWTGAIDVVHGTNFVVPPTRRAASLVTIHDLTCMRFPEMCTPDTLEYPALVRRALQRGAHVHAVSQFVADEVVELLGADPDQVHVVHHGLPDVLGGDPHRGRTMVGAKRYVLALGTVEPRKDLVTLVKAFHQIADADPDVHLAIAGPDGWGAEALTALISSSPHRSRIRRLGWVCDSDRAALLAGATIFAYPSRYEGFGFPPIEAMSVGVPVATTSAGALPEVLGDAALFVAPGSVDDLSDSLRRLLDDDELRGSLIERGTRRCAEYRWEACAAGLTAVYRSLAG